MTSTQTLSVGDKVAIVLPADSALFGTKWFPKHGATGTVERIFKNGTLAVAVDQVRNFSDDGKKTLHFPASNLEVIR